MKSERLKAIIDIINNEEIETQGELSEKLKDIGFDVTQATVSRDIKEIGLIKVPVEDGKSKYILPMQSTVGQALTRFERVIRDAVLSLDYVDNLVVIKTLPGSAQLVASVLDNEEWEEIMGTIAGDDTILVISKKESVAKKIIEKIMGTIH